MLKKVFRKDQTCCVLCENKAHVCQHVCVIIQWMEEFSPPSSPGLEIKAINAAQDVGSEVMDAEGPELAARGASALGHTSNNTQLQARCSAFTSHADQTRLSAGPSTTARGQRLYQLSWQPGMRRFQLTVSGFTQLNIASSQIKFPDIKS